MKLATCRNVALGLGLLLALAAFAGAPDPAHAWEPPLESTETPTPMPSGVTLYGDRDYAGQAEFFAADAPGFCDDGIGAYSASSIRPGTGTLGAIWTQATPSPSSPADSA